MKIKQETAEGMVLEKSPLKWYIVGGVITFLGLLIVLQSSGQSWLGWGMIVVGVFIFLMTKRVTVTLDKKEGKMVFERKSLISGKREEHDFDALKYLEIYYKHMRGFPGGSSKKQQSTLNLAFVFSDTNEVLLDSYQSTIHGIFEFFLSNMIANTMAEMGIRVARFLNVPFQDHRQVNVAEAFSAVQSSVESSIQQVFGDDEQK